VIALDDDGNATEVGRVEIDGGGATGGPGDGRISRAAYSFSTPMRIGVWTNAIDTTGKWWDGDIAYVGVHKIAYSLPELRRLAHRVIDEQWPQDAGMVAQWTLQDGAAGAGPYRDKTAAYHMFPVASHEPAIVTGDTPAVDYRPHMTMPTALVQSIDPRATRATVGSVTVRVLDRDEWLTGRLAALQYRVRQRSAYLYWGWSDSLEGEYRLIMRGAIESIDPLPGRAYEIRIGDASRFARTSIPLGRTRLDGAITSTATLIDVDSARGFAAVAPTEWPTVAEDGYLRVGDEIMRWQDVTLSGGDIRFTSLVRGDLGSSASTHADKAAVEELLVARDIHPIIFALQILMSRRSGQADGTDFDIRARYVLDTVTDVEGRGAGLSRDDIDHVQWRLRAIADYDALGSDYHGTFAVLRDIVDVKEFVEREILRPLAGFMYSASDGRLRLGRWHVRAADSTVREITQAIQVRPAPSVDFSRILNAILVRYDLDILQEAYGQVIAYEQADSGVAHGRSEAMRIESPWIRSADFGGSPAYTPGTITDTLRDVLFARFKEPLFAVDVTVPLRYWDVEIDGLVTLEHPELPDYRDGRRHLQDRLMQVVGRRLDLRRGRVELRLIEMPDPA